MCSLLASLKVQSAQLLFPNLVPNVQAAVQTLPTFDGSGSLAGNLDVFVLVLEFSLILFPRGSSCGFRGFCLQIERIA